MANDRVELDNKELDNVLGGLTFETENKTVQANWGGPVYHFYKRKDLVDWVTENCAAYEGWDPADRDNDMLQKLLAAGIIY